MIEFKHGNYFIGFWYLEYPDDWGDFGLGGNTLSAVWREQNANVWKMRLRHRHYCGEPFTGATVFHSDDVMRWHFYEMPLMPEAVVIERQNRVFQILSRVAQSTTDFFHLAGDLVKMVALAEAGKTPPWLNIKIVRQGDSGAEPQQVSISASHRNVGPLEEGKR